MNNEYINLISILPEDHVSTRVIFKDATRWLWQKAIAKLFGYSSDISSLCLNSIVSGGKPHKDSVAEIISTTVADKRNEAEHRGFNKIKMSVSYFENYFNTLSKGENTHD